MPLFVVAGMHRAGTSALTGVTGIIGAELGDEDDHTPAVADQNPKGFFELRAAKELNERILERLGGDWQATPQRPLGWADDQAFTDLREAAGRILAGLPHTDEVVVLKDPRFSLTLPLWSRVTPIAGVLVALRHPAEVAASLQRRNGMEPAHAAALWLEYTSAAVVQDVPRLLVPYDELLTASASAAVAIARFLGLPSPDDAALASVASFLEDGLRHHDAARGDVASTLLPAVRFLDWLGDATADHGRPGVRRLDGQLLPARLVADAMALAGAGGTTEDAQRLREDLDRIAGKYEQAVRHIDALRATIEKRDARLATLDETHDEIARRLRDLAAEDRVRAAEAEQLLVHEQQVLAAERDRSREERRLLEARNAGLERAYDRLRNRRVVRLALLLAGLARPVFRVVRRLRGGGGTVTNRAEADAGPTASLETAAASVPDGEPPAGVGEATGAGDELGSVVLTAAGRRPEGAVTVLVPVHDAPAAVRRCLESVRRNTTGQVELLVIDDASELDATRELLDGVATWPSTTVLRNEENLGFTRTVNRGLEATDGDVVLLNSDTVVPPRWVERLQLAAYSGDRVGSATAVSDDAGAFSVPVPGRRNPVPPMLDDDGIGRAAAVGPDWPLVETPTMHGFCVYLRRDMLEEVGLLDATAFPRGYGEENDLSMRAAQHGWSHVIAGGVLVRHVKGSSFGAARDELIRAGRAVIDERHPTYTEQVRAFLDGPGMASLQARYHRWWNERDERDGRPTVLVVLHDGGGGTPRTSLDLAAGLEEDWRTLVLVSSADEFLLTEVRDGQHVELERRAIEPPIRFGEGPREDVAAYLAGVCMRQGVELVHVRHLIKHTLDVLDTPRALGIPLMVSLHDYYVACPTVHLIDEEQRFCGGTCTAGPGPCGLPMPWIEQDAPPLKHGGVHDWRAMLLPRLSAADALVTTSEAAESVLRTAYPELGEDAITVIEHGRDMPVSRIRFEPPKPDEPIRLLLAGNIGPHKGADYVRTLLAHDTGGRVELHVLGRVRHEDRDLGTAHGPYRRDEFLARVAEIAPHFVGIFSIWGETYSHTLTEGWSTGVPVVATDIGAVGDRIREHGGGILVPVDDPAEALRRMLEVAGDPAAYEELCGAGPGAVRSVTAMADDYRRLYSDVLGRHRGLATPDASLDAAVPIRLRVVDRAPGDLLHQLQVAALQQVAGLDLVWSGETAVGGAVELATDGPRVRAVGDDGRVDVAAVRELLEGPLGIDGTWFGGPSAAGPAPPPAPADVLRLLHVAAGTTTPADLAFLQRLVARLPAELARPVRLTVVAAGQDVQRADWFHAADLPKGPYLERVRWLRALGEGHDIGLVPVRADAPVAPDHDVVRVVLAGAGCATVFADHPAFARVVDGENGLLAPPDDLPAWIAAVARLASDDERELVAAVARADAAADARRRATSTGPSAALPVS